LQEIGSNRYAGIFGTNDMLLTGKRGLALRRSIYIHSPVSNLLDRMNDARFLSRSAPLRSRREVAITHSGSIGEFLMMAAEHMVIPAGQFTLGQGLSWSPAMECRGIDWNLN
jgi:hypothetical protein